MRSGLDLLDDGKAYDDYITNRYHQPSGTFDPNWDLSGMVQDLRLLYMVGSKLSTGTTPFPMEAG